jgi:hypothetical protein
MGEVRTILNRGLCWLLASLLVACQSLEPGQGYYSNPLGAGAEIVLQRELLVPAGLARVYLQHGETVSYQELDQYAPFCYFLMSKPLPDAQTIHPGVLSVRAVRQEDTEVRREPPVRLASMAGFTGGWGNRSVIAMQTHMNLSAPDQPALDKLVCSGAFQMPMDAKPIRLHEMREVFGGIAEIREQAAPQEGR